MWDAVFGTSCPAPEWFWTAVHLSQSSVYSVRFSGGVVLNFDLQARNEVRCVWTTQENPMDEPRFVDLGETVFDRLTGLEWEKVPCSSGRTWEQALLDCVNSTKAGGGWRLPNVKELYSVVEIPGTGCWWNQVFQGGCDWYWTSTPAPWELSDALCVHFDGGGVGRFFVKDPECHGVRCVRAGQE